MDGVKDLIKSIASVKIESYMYFYHLKKILTFI